MNDTTLVRRLTTILAIDVVASAPCRRATRSTRSPCWARAWTPAGTLITPASRPRLQADRRRPAGGIRQSRSRPSAPRSRSRRRCARPTRRPAGRPARPAHRRQSGRRRRKRRRSDGRCRQRRGAPGIDRHDRRHLRVVVGLRADRRQADAGRRGYRRAARQEHPAPHPCLPPDRGRPACGAIQRPQGRREAGPAEAPLPGRRHDRGAGRRRRRRTLVPAPRPRSGAAADRCAAHGGRPSSAPAAAPAPRRRSSSPRAFDAKDVPFVPDFRRRALENYASANGSQGVGAERPRHLRHGDATDRRPTRHAVSRWRIATSIVQT